ncbi:F0F1 ATP synthase subunit B [Paludibacteraceae bacterium OttesenSCG-928-F17]|nr:F0F1 ATP synthase subunit B [Paludibacteraceae bacterium OttesenSCG-928-F17]
MSLLTPEPGLLFWMLLSFGIVFFILAKYGFPVIVKMVDKRKAYIDESLESAKAANAQLADIKKESERILDVAHEEESKILKEAQEMRIKMIDDAKKQASLEAAKMINDARVAVEKEKEKAMRDIHNEIASFSIDIAEKVLRRNLDDRDAQQELIDKLVQEAQQN